MRPLQTKRKCLSKPGSTVIIQGVMEGKPMADDVLTAAEIHSRLIDEWVVVENPQTNEALEVEAGKVVCHSKDRDEVYRQAIASQAPRFAVLYTGPTVPPGTAVIL